MIVMHELPDLNCDSFLNCLTNKCFLKYAALPTVPAWTTIITWTA